MNLWFTSDTHFGHGNILEYAERPFPDLEKMEEVLVRNWNERIKPDDMVIFIGDFCFKNSAGGKDGEDTRHKAKYYLDQLNGHIVFIRGNHDRNNSLNTKIKSLVLEIAGYTILCIHEPAEADTKYSLVLAGHVHQNWKIRGIGGTSKHPKTIMVNVGVDVWKFRPVSIQEITKAIEQWKKAHEGKLLPMYSSVIQDIKKFLWKKTNTWYSALQLAEITNHPVEAVEKALRKLSEEGKVKKGMDSGQSGKANSPIYKVTMARYQ